MAYEPTVWKTGDVVTSSKLNKLENAVANDGPLIVNVTFEEFDPDAVNSGDTSTKMYSFTLDKTFQQIYDAFTNGRPVLLKIDDPQGVLNGGVSFTAIDIVKTIFFQGELCSVISARYEYDIDYPNGYPSTIEKIEV